MCQLGERAMHCTWTHVRHAFATACTTGGVDDALIIGTGVQARYQARYICQNMKINNLHFWGRDNRKVNKLFEDLKK